jgi:hypothetical protein
MEVKTANISGWQHEQRKRSNYVGAPYLLAGLEPLTGPPKKESHLPTIDFVGSARNWHRTGVIPVSALRFQPRVD